MPPRKKGKVTSAAVDHSERLKELLSECRCARPNRPKIEKLLDLLPPDTDALRQAMFAAVRQQRADVLEWVLKRGADANVSEDDTASAWRALPIAIGNTCCPCVSLLLAHGAKLAQRDVNQAVHGLHDSGIHSLSNELILQVIEKAWAGERVGADAGVVAFNNQKAHMPEGVPARATMWRHLHKECGEKYCPVRRAEEREAKWDAERAAERADGLEREP